MSNFTLPPRTLFDLKSFGLGTTLTASGNSGSSPLVDLLDVTDVWLSLYVTGTPTGTTPTLLAQLDVQDADGNWIPGIVKTATVNAAGASAWATAGQNMPTVSTTSASLPLPRYGRIAWTVAGTTPVFPSVSICLSGR